MRVFARVARTGSFSRAGRELGLSQPSVSRIAAALEREVGAALLKRTTRAVTVTEAGADYLARIQPILAALEEADHAARGTGELRGTLRVALSWSLAVREVIPRLPAFMDRHPALRIDLLMDDQRHDLLIDGVDVAFRYGTLADSNATARRLAGPSRMLVASPAYLRRAGVPKSPADLSTHSVIVGPAGIGGESWTFERDGRTVSRTLEGRLNVSQNEGAVVAASIGLGIASTALWGCRAELLSGTLVQVLADWRMEPAEMHALFPAGATKPSARAFADYLLTYYGDSPKAEMRVAATPAACPHAYIGAKATLPSPTFWMRAEAPINQAGALSSQADATS